MAECQRRGTETGLVREKLHSGYNEFEVSTLGQLGRNVQLPVETTGSTGEEVLGNHWAEVTRNGWDCQVK